VTESEHRDPADLPDGQIERMMSVAYRLFRAGDAESELAAIEWIYGRSSRILLPDADGPGGGEPEGTATTAPASRYRVLGEIGRGDIGIVYEGRDVNLGRTVALKALRPELAEDDDAVRRFLEEAQLESQLQHPGVVPVYSLGLDERNRPYFVMKLVRGETLASLLAKRGEPARALRRFLGIFEQTCQCVAYAHARGVVHRDLNPQNVMVGAFGEVQVVDWGLAKLLDRPDGKAADVSSGAPAYLAPEEARGRTDEVDERADVFSLGAMLCEILTGVPPYTRGGAEELAQAREGRVAAAWARLDECGADEELVALAKRCLAPEPESRPRNGGEVGRMMGNHLAGAERRAREAAIRTAEERSRAQQERDREERECHRAAWERRARSRTTAIAAIILATVLLGGLAYFQKDRVDRARAARNLAAVTDAMERASFHRGQGDWAAASDWARRALETAGMAEVDPETMASATALREKTEEEEQAARRAIRRRDEDAEMLARLERLRARRRSDDQTDPAEIHAAYAAEFRDVGIDVERLPAEQAAAKIRERGIAVDLAATLDDWSWMVRPAPGRDRLEVDAGLWHKLLTIARLADPDEWRDRYREAALDLSRPREIGRIFSRGALFRAFAAQPGIEGLSPRALVLLANHLEIVEDPRTRASVLRRAYHQHPGDFWVNVHLSDALHHLGRREASLAHLRAAVALKPEARAFLQGKGDD
jgi:serine/threonine-protein kinase